MAKLPTANNRREHPLDFLEALRTTNPRRRSPKSTRPYRCASDIPNAATLAPRSARQTGRRPSRHYGRQRFHDTRQQNGALVREIERETTNAPLVPVQPDLLERTTIDKSALTFGEPKRLRDKGHLRFVGSQPCLVCGRQPADAHHLRFAQPRALGLKVSDEFTVPLCRGHHRAVHQTGNEAAWWEDLDINALEIARGLWEQSRGLNVGPGEKHVAHPEPEAAPSATTRSQP